MFLKKRRHARLMGLLRSISTNGGNDDGPAMLYQPEACPPTPPTSDYSGTDSDPEQCSDDSMAVGDMYSYTRHKQPPLNGVTTSASSNVAGLSGNRDDALLAKVSNFNW